MNNIEKKYVELERKRLNPRDGDCFNVANFSDFRKKTAVLQADEATCVKKVGDANHRKEIFKFETVGILPLIITVMAAVAAMVAIDLGDVAKNFTLIGFRWLMYLILGIGLAVECIIMNEKDKISSIALRILWFVFCVYFGWIRGMMVFGSDLNWIFVYFVGSAVLLLLLRTFEYLKTVAPAYATYRKNCQYVGEREKLVDEMAALYSTLGDKAWEQQKQLMSENAIAWQPRIREPWFTFSRESDDKWGRMLTFPKGHNANTNFEPKKDYYSDDGDSSFSERVISQFLDFEELTPADALEMIDKRELSPLFEMGLPAIYDNMECRVYRHSWEISYCSTMTFERTEWRADAKELREFDDAVDSYEYNRYRGSADNYVSGSLVEEGYRQMYIEKRDKARQALHNQKVVTTDKNVYTHTEKGDEIAFLEVYDPESGLRGFFSANSIQSVEFTVQYLEDTYKYKTSAATVANNEAQRWYLYSKYLRRTDEKLDDSSEYFHKK